MRKNRDIMKRVYKAESKLHLAGPTGGRSHRGKALWKILVNVWTIFFGEIFLLWDPYGILFWYPYGILWDPYGILFFFGEIFLLWDPVFFGEIF